MVPSVDSLYTRKSQLVADEDGKNIYNKYDTELAPINSQVVGYVDKELPHDRFTQSVLGSWVTNFNRVSAGTQVALINGGGLRCPIPAGYLTMGKLYELAPFDNILIKMNLKGSDLKRVLENGIGNTEVGSVQQSGLIMTVDLTKPFGNRITSLKLLDGTVIDPNGIYSVTANDFMVNIDNLAKGGDGYNFSGATDIVNTGIDIRQSIVDGLSKLPVPMSEALTPATPVPSVLTPATPVPQVLMPSTLITAKNSSAEVINTLAAAVKVVVDATSNSTVSKDVFAAIKGQDKTVTFNGNNVSWTINGKYVTDATKDIDISLKDVSSDLKTKEAAKIKAVLGQDVKIASFSFKYDGQLPENTQIKVLIGKDWANKTVNVCRYYADKNTYEVVATANVDADGYMTYTTNHCSDYFVVEKTASMNLPKTGSALDMNVLLGLGAILAVAGIVLVVRTSRRRNAA